jgi:hypothetical protein
MEKTEENKKATHHVSSTTQGGSNFGQGQSSLGDQQQGTEKSAGSDYENEQGWNNEAPRMEDIQPVKKETEEEKKKDHDDKHVTP